MSRTTIPVTVLNGTLGAGRITVLNDHLPTRTDVDIAALVPDMDEVTVDADRIADHADIASDNEDRCRA